MVHVAERAQKRTASEPQRRGHEGQGGGRYHGS